MASGAKPVRVLNPEGTTHLTLVGCGGTGGFVLTNACRLVWGLREQRRAAADAPPLFGETLPGSVPEILLCDGDTVERKNLVRQDFFPADVGRPKALVLAERRSADYGLEVSAYPRYIKEGTDLKTLAPEGGIVVGCVDNAATRRILHEKLSSYEDVVYVDAGNAGVEVPEDPASLSRSELRKIRESGWSGQVLCGVRKGGETLLPFPADVMPDLVESAGGAEDLVPDEVPCGEIVVSAPQRHATNLWAAALLYDYLQDLLSDGTVLHARSFFDARRKYVKSYPAIDDLDQVAV